MEGLVLQFVPSLASLVAGILILAIVAVAVAYGWRQETRSHATTEREPLRKAA